MTQTNIQECSWCLEQGHEVDKCHKYAKKMWERYDRINSTKLRMGRIIFTACLILILFGALVTKASKQRPILGKLFNCESTTYAGIYAIPDPFQCLKTSKLAKINSFDAEIWHYKPRSTRFPIFRCTLMNVELFCSENFLWMKRKKEFDTYLDISVPECRNAQITKKFANFPLIPNGFNSYHTDKASKHYTCRYGRDTSVWYKHLTITKSYAHVEGDDVRIVQEITNSKCFFRRLHCIPMESPNEKLIWHAVEHDYNIYHSLGVHSVKQIYN